MLTTIFCSTLLLCSAGAELLLTVTPEIVEPGITPFVTLRCSLAEHEEGNIAALALYRRSITAKPETTSPQLVAEILGTSPTIPSLVPGFEGLTVQGQISPIEEELETYLEVVWPNPTVSDLGLYSCEVTVLSETGGVTTLVEERVTSSNAVTDKLLATVLALEEQLLVLNQSVYEIYAEIDNITQALDTEIRPAVESYGAVRLVENATEAETRPIEDTPTDEKTLTEDIETTETPSQPSDVDLNIIVEGLEVLKSRLENISDSLGRINVVISSLTERADAEWETTTVQADAQSETTTVQADAERETTTVQAAAERETTTVQADVEPETPAVQVPTRPEVILTLFESYNSSYYLFKAEDIDTRRAQVVCAIENLYLAEINDENEFLSISNQTSLYLDTGVIVLVGGERQSAQDDFLFQNSKELVQFATPDFRSEVGFPNGTCLALLQSTDGLTFTSVPCSSDDATYHYFLCEQEQVLP